MARRGPGGTLVTVPPITVLTVDDHASFRAAARAVVAATPGFAPVGEFASAEEALEAAVELDPALALVDVNMPGIDGIATSRRLLRARPGHDQLRDEEGLATRRRAHPTTRAERQA